MNVENLSEGQIVKNYRELCDILNIKVTTGKSKQYQLKELENYCEYDKQGQKFIIKVVYDFKKIMIGAEGNNMYGKDIQLLLVDLLNQSDSGELFISAGALLRKLDMINDNYMVARRNIPKLSELTEVSQENCYDFYSYTQTSLKGKLESALKGLRSKALIIWENATTVCVKNPKIQINEFGTIKVSRLAKRYDYVDVETTHRRATQWEKDLILECEDKIMTELCCLTLQEVYKRGKWNYFKDKVNKMIFDKANIEYYYSSYDIVYKPELISKALENNIFNVEETKDSLSCNIINSLIKGAETRYSNSKSKEMVGEELNSKDRVCMSDSYVSDTKKLTEVVINYKATDLRKELKKALIKDKNSTQMSFELNDDIPF